MKTLQILSLFSIFSLLSCSERSSEWRVLHAPFPESPNILWISCEDMSPRLGCYGDSVARTPNIDRLASEGCRFTNVFTSAPVCAPCRAGIITGMYQTSIGAHHMRTSQPGDGLPTPYETVPPHFVKTFTEYLRARGYYCTNNSKTDYQIGNPFTAWDESGPQAHYRNRPDSSQPFFAVFNIHRTHELHTWGKPRATDPDRVEVPPYYPDIPEARNAIAVHYDNIAIMDSIVGTILAELEASGLADNTLVFFWSDHGDGLPRAKRWPYDSGTHIPLIIRWPGHIFPGSEEDRLVSSIDLGPSVLSAAGIIPPEHMEGRAFLGAYEADPHPWVISARDRYDQSYDMMRSVRDKQFRYVRNFYPDQPYVLYVPYRNNSPLMQKMLRMQARGELDGIPAQWFDSSRPVEELYDCEADPWNIHNLAADPKQAKKLREMRDILDSWMHSSGDMGVIAEARMVEDMWPGGKQPETVAPGFVVNAPGYHADSLFSEGGDFKYPTMVTLYCPTQGASMGYRIAGGPDTTWKLYTGPIVLESGTTVIEARAIRYGYSGSEITRGTFRIIPE